jgi:hypothetical protein
MNTVFSMPWAGDPPAALRRGGTLGDAHALPRGQAKAGSDAGMSRDLARALDPALIGRDVGLTLDQWQRDLLRSMASRVLLLASRQVGKSTTCGLLATHTIVTQPGALVLVVAPALRQSQELFRSAMGFLRQLPHAPEITAESALRVEL